MRIHENIRMAQLVGDLRAAKRPVAYGIIPLQQRGKVIVANRTDYIEFEFVIPRQAVQCVDYWLDHVLIPEIARCYNSE